jgi:hypothetical protein
MSETNDEGLGPSRCYAIVDLVVTQDKTGMYHATGGPHEAIFVGDGQSYDEAIGSWFRQNREAVNFQVSFVVNGGFYSSTRYGVGRSKDQLGPHELKALEKFEQSKSA